MDKNKKAIKIKKNLYSILLEVLKEETNGVLFLSEIEKEILYLLSRDNQLSDIIDANDLFIISKFKQTSEVLK